MVQTNIQDEKPCGLTRQWIPRRWRKKFGSFCVYQSSLSSTVCEVLYFQPCFGVFFVSRNLCSGAHRSNHKFVGVTVYYRFDFQPSQEKRVRVQTPKRLDPREQRKSGLGVLGRVAFLQLQHNTQKFDHLTIHYPIRLQEQPQETNSRPQANLSWPSRSYT